MTSQCPMVRPPLNHTSESELSASQGSTPNPVSFGHEPRPEVGGNPASVEQVTQTPRARYRPLGNVQNANASPCGFYYMLRVASTSRDKTKAGRSLLVWNLVGRHSHISNEGDGCPFRPQIP